MLLLHMLFDSVDSLFVVGILGPTLARAQALRLILALGLCDALASFCGPFVRVAEQPEAILVWFIAAVVVALALRRAHSTFIAILPVVCSLDNLLDFPGHAVSVGCSLEFGLASLVMAAGGFAAAKGLERVVSWA